LLAVRDVVEMTDQGEALLAASRPTEARSAFRQAQELAGGSDEFLFAWEARAAAEEGELRQAIALLDEALTRNPTFAIARYNRASYWARLGDLDNAAADLAFALSDGACEPREVLLDPDFQPHLSDPRFGFLPTEALSVAVEGPGELVFWGEEVRVRLQLLGAGNNALQIDLPQIDTPLELVRVVEDDGVTALGDTRDITWVFRVTGSGETSLGPFDVLAGRLSASGRPVEIVTAVPKAKEQPLTRLPVEILQPPSARVGTRSVPAAWRAGERLYVLAEAGDRVDVEGSPPPVRTYERRKRGEAQWTIWTFEDMTKPVDVSIRRRGEILLEERVAL
jgi:hypothetical protein